MICSRGAEKYFRRGSRLNWPEGAVSRESIRAVNKLDRLKVYLFSPFSFVIFLFEFFLFYFWEGGLNCLLSLICCGIYVQSQGCDN